MADPPCPHVCAARDHPEVGMIVCGFRSVRDDFDLGADRERLELTLVAAVRLAS